jgi:CIC family chloride channel protein
VVVDADNRYLGMVSRHQLHDHEDGARVSSLEPRLGTEFDQHTSIWEAMETMRDYIGEAIAVIDANTGRYLGAVSEAVIINAYLDAAQELRREEYEV